MTDDKIAKKKWRISYQPARVWRAGYKQIIGRAILNLTHKEKTVVNLFVEIYDKGKYPWFRKQAKRKTYIINIPLPMLQDLCDEAAKTGKRIQKTNAHTWTKKKYKSKTVKAVVENVQA